MGKAAMCIQMLEVMNTGKVYKATELAKILETNPRNVIEYKKELEEAGYYITSVPGRYGGYQLDKSYCIPALKLSLDEKESIMEAYNYALLKKDFVKKDVFTKAMAKISSSIELPQKDQNLLVVDQYQLTMSEQEIKERYDFIELAISRKQVIEIDYNSIKKGKEHHILHPYKLFIYNNTWFFLAWNPEVNDVWYFKLNRIAGFKMRLEYFKVWSEFKAENYFDGNGFKNNGNFYHIELIATGPRVQLMKERVYGKNQEITPIDDTHIKVSLDMQNEGSVVSFALGAGTDIEILEPEWLKERIVSISKELINRYEITNDK